MVVNANFGGIYAKSTQRRIYAAERVGVNDLEVGTFDDGAREVILLVSRNSVSLLVIHRAIQRPALRCLLTYQNVCLHGGDLDIEAIAAEVGYVDGATLRTLLRQRLGRGVRDLRADLR